MARTIIQAVCEKCGGKEIVSHAAYESEFWSQRHCLGFQCFGRLKVRFLPHPAPRISVRIEERRQLIESKKAVA